MSPFTRAAFSEPVRCVCTGRHLPAVQAPPKQLFVTLKRRGGSSHNESRGNLQVTAAAGVGARATRWDDIWEFLAVQQQFESSPAPEIYSLVEAGSHVIVDVRPENQYAKSSIQNAINVPIYRKVDFSKPDFIRYVRALALMANGVEPVEPNPTFVEDVKAAAGGKGVVFVCEIGGTLTPTTSFSTGKVSRSLLAVYQALRSDGLDKVKHLTGGIYGWYNAGLPLQGEYDASLVGRTPLVVEEETFAYGRKPEQLNESR